MFLRFFVSDLTNEIESNLQLTSSYVCPAARIVYSSVFTFPSQLLGDEADQVILLNKSEAKLTNGSQTSRALWPTLFACRGADYSSRAPGTIVEHPSNVQLPRHCSSYYAKICSRQVKEK